jgi:hypothetical protein
MAGCTMLPPGLMPLDREAKEDADRLSRAG